MDSLSISRISCFTGITSRRRSYAPNIVRRRFVFTRGIVSISASTTTSPAQMAETEKDGVLVLQMFFKERELSGDIVTKAADQLWHRQQISKLVDVSSSTDPSLPQSEQETGSVEEYDDNGFLKLKTTKDWLLGEKSAPFNQKARAKAMRDDSEKRKKLNFLKDEAVRYFDAAAEDQVPISREDDESEHSVEEELDDGLQEMIKKWPTRIRKQPTYLSQYEISSIKPKRKK